MLLQNRPMGGSSLLIAILATIAGCASSGSEKAGQQSPTAEPPAAASANNAQAEAPAATPAETRSPIPGCIGACDPKGDEMHNALTGQWTIAAYAFSSVSATDEAGAKKNVGKTVEIGQAFSSPFQQCKAALWSMESKPIAAWLEAHKIANLTPAQTKALGLEGKDPLAVWTGECTDPKATGTIEIVATRGPLLISWDGAHYALVRATTQK